MWWKWLYYLNQSIDAMQSLLTTNGIFHRTKTDNFTIFMETQKTPKSQSNLEKEIWNWKNHPSWLQTILQSYSLKTVWHWYKKQKYRPMEQDRKPRDKPTQLWTLYLLTKKTKMYNWEKTVSSNKWYWLGKLVNYV